MDVPEWPCSACALQAGPGALWPWRGASEVQSVRWTLTGAYLHGCLRNLTRYRVLRAS